MKVCVFSSPRTRSSMILVSLAKYCGLNNYGETFSYGNRLYDVDNHRLMRLVNTDNYVVKITPTSFHQTFLRYDTFPWNTFDKIILMNRKNITEQIASWLVLEHAQREQTDDLQNKILMELQNFEQIKTPSFLIKYALRCLNEYYEIQEYIKQQDVPYIELIYENLESSTEQYMSLLNFVFNKQLTKDLLLKHNFTGANYNEYIRYKQLDLLCRSIIEQDNLNYLKKEIEYGNIIC